MKRKQRRTPFPFLPLSIPLIYSFSFIPTPVSLVTSSVFSSLRLPFPQIQSDTLWSAERFLWFLTAFGNVSIWQLFTVILCGTK